MSFRYTNYHDNIFSDVSITADDRSAILVCGDNGTGKSTLGKIICGLLPISEGVISIDNKNPHILKPSERIRTAYYIVQDIYLQFVRASILEEIILTSKIANRTINDIGFYTNYFLPHDKKIKPFDLSINQAWRFSLLLAEIISPYVLFIDEIPSFSNHRNRVCIESLITKRLQKGLITILSCQDEVDLTFTHKYKIEQKGITIV